MPEFEQGGTIAATAVTRVCMVTWFTRSRPVFAGHRSSLGRSSAHRGTRGASPALAEREQGDTAPRRRSVSRIAALTGIRHRRDHAAGARRRGRRVRPSHTSPMVTTTESPRWRPSPSHPAPPPDTSGADRGAQSAKTADRSSTSPRRPCRRRRRPSVVTAPGRACAFRDRAVAYRNAETIMAAPTPGCGISWNLLAGIGRIESGHANGGATDARGTAGQPDLRARAGRHAARQRGHRPEQLRRAGSPTPARWDRCSSCRAPGRATPPTATVTARPTRRTCTTPRWPPPATCAAAG